MVELYSANQSGENMTITSRMHSGACSATILFLLFILSGMAYADSCTDWVAKLDSFQGKVQAKRISSVEWKQVSKSDSFCAGDMLRVMEKSRAVIVLKNETIMRLDQNTTITLAIPAKAKLSLLDLLKGSAYFISRTPKKFRVYTSFLNAGIEGTEFLVTVRDNNASVSVFEGIVIADNSDGCIRLMQGQTASAVEGRAPVLSMTMKPKDAVQWTLYYPILSINPAAESLMVRISALLYSGAAGEAEAELTKVLSADPKDADALAFLSIISLAQNEKAKAMDYARRAIAAAPNSGTAQIALSYALQSGFDLESAMKSVRSAAQLEPNNALVWARLSELHLSLGDNKESLKAAEKAVSLSPDLSRTQTVLGFARLSEIKTDAAIAAFEKAAGFDSADPLPRLGLGLAKIRKGQLEEGRREIEIAVSLDTGNALIRSYLGKAYYEEKRDSVAADQFIMAEAADPKDPTAFFYSALQKQTENRPVEALRDLEKSLELNDNRVVYRSRLLLDQDQAARGASLARIYEDLGFQQLALAEGSKSVNADPANASAHRFLSDSYAALPRHEIARVSELLQAQLLQPVGLHPVQPHLADPGSFILRGAGPAAMGFNEYNSLFDRNRFSLLVSGVAGSNSTIGDEVVVSGLHDRFSISVGQFHYETHGFRKNNDVRQDIYNVFVQYSVSSRTSVQAEFRKEIKSYGDVRLKFSPDNFDNTERHRYEITSGRFGFHHSFGPGSDLIGNFGYLQAESLLRFAEPGVFTWDFGIKFRDSYIGELQHILKKEQFSLVSGIGYFGYRETDTDKVVFLGEPSSDSAGHHIANANIYLYPQIKYPDNVTWTIGLSADHYQGVGFDKDQVNPKLGMVWKPFPATTVRAAFFRALERRISTEQTIEPTQVAGFNQFLNVSEGTDTWTYGIGIDQKISDKVYAGLEYSRRKQEVPVGDLEFDWKERFGRAYLNYLPHKWLSLSAEYLYERFSRPDFNVTLLTTHRVPLGVSFNHPSGVSITAKATYIQQEGDFFVPPASPFDPPGSVEKHSSFWLFDASVGYRLPKRLGMISLVGKNLFDKSFNYQDMDPLNPALQPARSVFLKLTLAL